MYMLLSLDWHKPNHKVKYFRPNPTKKTLILIILSEVTPGVGVTHWGCGGRAPDRISKQNLVRLGQVVISIWNSIWKYVKNALICSKMFWNLVKLEIAMNKTLCYCWRPLVTINLCLVYSRWFQRYCPYNTDFGDSQYRLSETVLIGVNFSTI